MVGQAAESLPYTGQIVYACLEQSWSDKHCSPQYIQAMQRALALGTQSELAEPLSFMHLAGLCCQAAGGEPQQAIDIAAAWTSLYTAAHLLDDVEDGGPITPETATTLNAATGLIFTAFRVLSTPWTTKVSDRVRLAIVEDFARTALQMGCGQHLDLLGSTSSLDQCWKMVESKSGDCFALACRTGAMLAGAQVETVESYSQFGQHLGVILQIADDLHGIRATKDERGDLATGKRSLPIWYALSVAPLELREHLLHCLQTASHDPTAEARALELIQTSGAALYLDIETRRHCLQALTCLHQVEPLAGPGQQLARLLNDYCPLSQCGAGCGS